MLAAVWSTVSPTPVNWSASVPGSLRAPLREHKVGLQNLCRYNLGTGSSMCSDPVLVTERDNEFSYPEGVPRLSDEEIHKKMATRCFNEGHIQRAFIHSQLFPKWDYHALALGTQL